MLTNVKFAGEEIKRNGFLDTFKSIFKGISVNSMENQTYRLPPERQLENDNFSRAEINYQIRRLRDSGLIDSRRGDGNYLMRDKQEASMYSIKTLLDQLTYLGYLSSIDINKTRKTIELLICEYWIFICYEEQQMIVSELQLKINQMEHYFFKYKSTTNNELKDEILNKIICIDIDFHKIIGNIADTALLSIFISAISELQKGEIKKFWLSSSNDKRQALIDDHISILRSLEQISRLICENDDIFNMVDKLDKNITEREIETLQAFEEAKNNYRLAVTSHYMHSEMLD